MFAKISSHSFIRRYIDRRKIRSQIKSLKVDYKNNDTDPFDIELIEKIITYPNGYSAVRFVLLSFFEKVNKNQHNNAIEKLKGENYKLIKNVGYVNLELFSIMDKNIV